jgi:hypothetical protein
VLASQRRTRLQVPAHGRPAHQHRLEADVPDQPRGDLDRFGLVTGQWHADLARGLVHGAHARGTHGVESARALADLRRQLAVAVNVARGEHHLVTGAGPCAAEIAAHIAGADQAQQLQHTSRAGPIIQATAWCVIAQARRITCLHASSLSGSV